VIAYAAIEILLAYVSAEKITAGKLGAARNIIWQT
jgi:hypothetical protein